MSTICRRRPSKGALDRGSAEVRSSGAWPSRDGSRWSAGRCSRARPRSCCGASGARRSPAAGWSSSATRSTRGTAPIASPRTQAPTSRRWPHRAPTRSRRRSRTGPTWSRSTRRSSSDRRSSPWSAGSPIADIVVIVAGLDVTFDGRPFEPLPSLMALAERVDKLTAICTVCGEEAVFHVKLAATRGRPRRPRRGERRRDRPLPGALPAPLRDAGGLSSGPRA